MFKEIKDKEIIAEILSKLAQINEKLLNIDKVFKESKNLLKTEENKRK